MSPSLRSPRLLWVWSFPAFAIILSFLWYQKKRGSLKKTGNGGSDRTRDNTTSVGSEEEEEIAVSDKNPPDQVLPESGDRLKEEEEEEVAEATAAVEKEVIEVIEKIKSSFNVDTVVPRFVDVIESEILPVKEVEKKQENIQGKEIEVVEEEKVEKVVVEPQQIEVEVKTEEIKEKKEEDILKAIEESVVPQQEETKKEEKQKTVVTPKEIDYNQLVKIKCGKKKKYKDMAKKSKASLDQRQNKEENTARILEQKLAKLDLANQCSGTETEEKQTSEDVAERDSANNSPSEVMLASPSVSGYSDTHSEDSSDSGKGCSEMLTPSRTPASGNSVSGDLPATSINEFVIPQQLVGRLIGRHGSYVNEIKEATHASIYIKKHPDTPKLKICAVEGTLMDIESALEMIRRKFPKKRYPNLTLEQTVVNVEPQMIPITSENMKLHLIEGINNDVILSSLVSAGHFFLQQPTHPTYLSLSRLDSYMTCCYSEPDKPTIPEGIGAGIVCAAPVLNGWYRAQIIKMDPETKMCDIKFLDYGGYMTMPLSLLRQIRADFINLPFQAAECYLAGIQPANEDNIWCEKAKDLVEKLTYGKVLQAQVHGYAEDRVPLIYLYTVVNDEVILINQELVNEGYAEWIYTDAEVQELGGYDEFEETAQMAVTV